MVDIYITEYKDLKSLLNASKTIIPTIVGYRYGEIRIYKGIAYIPLSLGRGAWYIIYTRDFKEITDNMDAIEVTIDNQIKSADISDLGSDPKSIYFIILRPVLDDIGEMLIEKISS